jgi:hypothetical protein
VVDVAGLVAADYDEGAHYDILKASFTDDVSNLYHKR